MERGREGGRTGVFFIGHVRRGEKAVKEAASTTKEVLIDPEDVIVATGEGEGKRKGKQLQEKKNVHFVLMAGDG